MKKQYKVVKVTDRLKTARPVYKIWDSERKGFIRDGKTGQIVLFDFKEQAENICYHFNKIVSFKLK